MSNVDSFRLGPAPRIDMAKFAMLQRLLDNLDSSIVTQEQAIKCQGESCRHHGRCDHDPGDDCYERKRDTDPCPPPEHVDDVTSPEFQAEILATLPGLPATTNRRTTVSAPVILPVELRHSLRIHKHRRKT